MAGPNIIVSGAVFTDTLVSQCLTDFISVIPRLALDGRSPLGSAVYRVARLFRALKSCLKDLDDYYSGLAVHLKLKAERFSTLSTRATSIRSKPPRIWPHFRQYTDLSDNRVYQLEYLRRLTDHYRKTVFKAQVNVDANVMKQIVVKFACQYSKEAHELLANASLAPKLYYCEKVPSVAMWVVVMEYVEGKEVDDKVTDPQQINSLRRALTMLHDNGMVFGDLRCPNVLLRDRSVVLIDFDWCGKEGEVCYPSDISLSQGIWEESVVRGGLITKGHDEFHFRELTDQDL